MLIHKATVDGKGLGRSEYNFFVSDDKKIQVTHFSAHRGGCLFAGYIEIDNFETKKSKTISSTMMPMRDDECGYLYSLVKSHTM